MNVNEIEKMIDYYISLKYPIKITEMDEGGYFIEVIDLPGCMCDVKNIEQIPSEVEDAMRAWIEGTLENGGSIPVPSKEEIHSGTFIIRGPKSLHTKLVELAKHQGVSLNQMVISLLSERVTYNEISYKIQNTLWEFEKLARVKYQPEHIPVIKQPYGFPYPEEPENPLPQGQIWKPIYKELKEVA